MDVKKFCDGKGVTAPTISPLHIFKGYKSDDGEMKNQKHLRFEIIFSGLLFQNSKSLLHGDDVNDNINSDNAKF